MDKEEKLEHLKWVIKSRDENQKAAFDLFELLQNYQNKIKRRDFAFLAQDLIGVTFSLWRSAFLADKEGKLEIALRHAIAFLERVIQDNTIAYRQDRDSNEWTFNYYVNNARYTLAKINESWPQIVPNYELKKRKPKDRWEYNQKLLTKAISNFKAELEKEED